jgi:MYXO-CTERM domain-containing protein
MRALAAVLVLTAATPAWATDWTLSTTTAGGNGQSGNMFALTTTNEVVITGFQLYIGSGDTTDGCDWEVWTSSSDYTTVYDDETQWTMQDSGTVATPTGFDDLVDISLTTGVTLASGTTTSFYVTVTDAPYCSLNYTNGSSQGAAYASDANLEIDEGYGMAYPFVGYFSPRIFNGGIYYQTCEDGYLDVDGDGYGDATSYDCHYEGTIVADDTDCDDADVAVNPGATEVWYDGVDADCGGDSDYDADMDGHDSDAHSGDDCDDTNADINPSATELWYDGIDQDCAGDSDYDADMDGHDSDAHEGTDCDDADAAISPDASELWYDGIDQDCAGDSDYDADMDGYDSDAHEGEDCDDTVATTNPAAEEVWYDGVDADCAGDSDYDADMDGHDSDAHEGEDCDDSTPDVNPDAEDTPDDGIDQDCDGADATAGGDEGGGSDGGGSDGGGSDGGAGDGTGDGTGGDDGAATDEDGTVGGDGGAGKGSCATAGASPSTLLWLAGALGLVGLGRRRR